jgi:TRAP-type C4-dicarboxylate transport system permease small subunit
VSEKDDDEAASPGVNEGAVPAEPTRASVDLEEARREALADPDMKPGVVHGPPESDDGEGDAVPKSDPHIPKTRPHETQPPVRESALQIEPPPSFPDDGPLSKSVRRFDHYIGLAEQAALFLILAIVILVASTHAIKEKATHLGLWWSADVIRGGTFTIAMIAAAYATQQQRHLAMDLISKKLPVKGRLLLAAAIEIFTIAICLMLLYSGWRQIGAAGKETGRHLFQAKNIVMFLPIGAGLISLHAFLHLIIHLDYFARGKTPPERVRSAH